MKKVIYLLGFVAIAALVVYGCEKNTLKEGVSGQEDAVLKAKDECTTIQSGTLYNVYGDVLETGYDEWGYNYQAHMFNGTYCDAYHDAAWCQPWAADELSMKWNDAWLSNEDCDGDSYLDRHYGYTSYKGSGAWLTNHLAGTYTLDDGTVCKWTEFYKIIAVPEDAVKTDGYWYNADGTEIGPSIWGDFAIIQHVYNDPCAGYNGLDYVSPDHAGLGGW
jgi:hypothetical protein